MIRLSRLADYGIVLLTYAARRTDCEAHCVADLAAEAGLPVPTVSKVVKQMARGGLLVSHRGPHGGYQLARRPEEITLAEIVTALEGPITLTECSGGASAGCDHSHRCPARGNLQLVNNAIHNALHGITLAQMAKPLPADILLHLERMPVRQRRGSTQNV